MGFPIYHDMLIFHYDAHICVMTRFSFSFQERNVDLFMNLVPEYDYTYWSCSVARLGYSGTAVISRVCSLLAVVNAQHLPFVLTKKSVGSSNAINLLIRIPSVDT